MSIFDANAALFVSPSSLPSNIAPIFVAAAATERMDNFSETDLEAAQNYCDAAMFDDHPTPCDWPTEAHISLAYHQRLAADLAAELAEPTDRWADDGGR